MSRTWQKRPLWMRLLIIFAAVLLLFLCIGPFLPPTWQLVFYVICVLGGAMVMWRENMALQRRRFQLEEELDQQRANWVQALPRMLRSEEPAVPPDGDEQADEGLE